MFSSDLTVESFLILRSEFFENDGTPKPFPLRDKKGTQDDPLDEHIALILSKQLTNAHCQKSPGPLISPDMAVFRDTIINTDSTEILDTSKIVGIEVKKLERTEAGNIARSTGLDYNTTPPCGTIRIYQTARGQKEIFIKGFYLFVCLEKASTSKNTQGGADRETFYKMTALVLCDGDVLNKDRAYYLQITGKREKSIRLGTYGDGVNRNRPMTIFANPLGAKEFDQSVTLITQEDLSADSRLKLAYRVLRRIPKKQEVEVEGIGKVEGLGEISDQEDGEDKEEIGTKDVFLGENNFYAYRSEQDILQDWKVKDLIDPFPKPKKRDVKTQERGRFRLATI